MKLNQVGICDIGIFNFHEMQVRKFNILKLSKQN
jgi:hypothetical protein